MVSAQVKVLGIIPEAVCKLRFRDAVTDSINVLILVTELLYVREPAVITIRCVYIADMCSNPVAGLYIHLQL